MSTISIYNDVITVSYQLNANKLCTRFCEVVDEDTGEIFESDTRTENLKLGRLNKSGFGKSARRRFMYAIDAFSSVFETLYHYNHESLYYKFNNKSYTRKPIFLTLTIPNQTLSDKECNRFLLNEFLTIIKKYFPIKLWLWRAEVQNRGALHYHLILDCFLPISFVRKLWFNLLYKNKQHGSVDNWEVASRICWVNVINKIDSIKFYLQKYLIDIDKRQIERVNKHDKKTVLRAINSREWGCSDLLKDVNTIYKNATPLMVENIEKSCIEKKSIIAKSMKTIADIFIFKKFEKIGKGLYNKIEKTCNLIKENNYRLVMQIEFIYNNSNFKPSNIVDIVQEKIKSKNIIDFYESQRNFI